MRVLAAALLGLCTLKGAAVASPLSSLACGCARACTIAPFPTPTCDAPIVISVLSSTSINGSSLVDWMGATPSAMDFVITSSSPIDCTASFVDVYYAAPSPIHVPLMQTNAQTCITNSAPPPPPLANTTSFLALRALQRAVNTTTTTTSAATPISITISALPPRSGTVYSFAKSVSVDGTRAALTPTRVLEDHACCPLPPSFTFSAVGSGVTCTDLVAQLVVVAPSSYYRLPHMDDSCASKSTIANGNVALSFSIVPAPASNACGAMGAHFFPLATTVEQLVALPSQFSTAITNLAYDTTGCALSEAYLAAPSVVVTAQASIVNVFQGASATVAFDGVQAVVPPVLLIPIEQQKQLPTTLLTWTSTSALCVPTALAVCAAVPAPIVTANSTADFDFAVHDRQVQQTMPPACAKSAAIRGIACALNSTLNFLSIQVDAHFPLPYTYRASDPVTISATLPTSAPTLLVPRVSTMVATWTIPGVSAQTLAFSKPAPGYTPCDPCASSSSSPSPPTPCALVFVPSLAGFAPFTAARGHWDIAVAVETRRCDGTTPPPPLHPPQKQFVSAADITPGAPGCTPLFRAAARDVFASPPLATLSAAGQLALDTLAPMGAVFVISIVVWNMHMYHVRNALRKPTLGLQQQRHQQPVSVTPAPEEHKRV